MGSSPFQLHCTISLFLFSFIVFFIVLATGKPLKKIFIYFFHFPIEPKIFILNIFKKIFSCFTHYETQKNFLYTFFLFFFFSSVASQLLHRCSSLNTGIHTTRFFFCELNFNPFPCAKTGIIFQNFTKPNLFLSKTRATVQNFLDHSVQNSSTS